MQISKMRQYCEQEMRLWAFDNGLWAIKIEDRVVSTRLWVQEKIVSVSKSNVETMASKSY